MRHDQYFRMGKQDGSSRFGDFAESPWLGWKFVVSAIVATLIIMGLQKWLCDCCKELPTWTDIAGVVVAGLGVIFALLQWDKQVKEKKAEFFDSLLQRFFSEDVQDFLQRAIDPDIQEEWFSRLHEADRDFRYKVNAIFMFLTQLCYLKAHKLIDKEFDFFADQIKELLQNSEAVSYLYSYVDKAYRHESTNPYVELILYGQQVGLKNDLYALIEKDGSYTEESYYKISSEESSRHDGANESASQQTFFDRKEGEAIGKYIQRVLFVIVPKLKREELDALMDGKFCKELFGLTYPMLKDAYEASATVWHRHYYVQIVEACGLQLRIVNEWKVSHFERIENWCKKQASLLNER